LKRRTLKRGAAGALGLLIGLALLGAGYESVGRRRDRERFPRVGRAIDIGGRILNLACSGVGAPVVIFESGAGSPGCSWTAIQARVAELTQACWYDRAGEGWSDPGPFPRTSEAIARDLHELLQRAGIPPPYVLVGHSFGGLTVRVYNGLYPEEVAGAVLVESAHEDEPTRAPAAFVGPKPPRWLWRPLHYLFMGSARVGLLRLFARRVDRSQALEALRVRPTAIATANSVGVVAPESYRQARSAGGFGDRPLIVLTRGRPFGEGPGSAIDPQLTDWFNVWVHELQANLSKLSTRGRQIIVTNSGHDVPHEAPEAVTAAVNDVVTAVRRGW
jgi:pimeloyl-ACP methyl ester carboxylesterase